MEPSSNSKANGAGYAEDAFSQPWWKYGECPEGTIPILRPQNHTGRFVKPLTPEVKRLNRSVYDLPMSEVCKNTTQYDLHNRSVNNIPLGGRHEYATVTMSGGLYTGANARINVWNPWVMNTEAHFSQLWIATGPMEWINTIEAGIMISTTHDPKYQPKLFIYWTTDGYGETGCYNLECNGFVQMNPRVTLGALVRPVSTYNGDQYDLTFYIKKHEISGSWWLNVGGNVVGYWPATIFVCLKFYATRIDWGGEIVNTGLHNRHTSTEMGSGHFPSEGFEKAAYFHNLRYVDDEYVDKDPVALLPAVTRPECYDVKQNVDSYLFGGVNFYYGGPGNSDICQTALKI